MRLSYLRYHIGPLDTFAKGFWSCFGFILLWLSIAAWATDVGDGVPAYINGDLMNCVKVDEIQKIFMCEGVSDE